MNLEVLRNRVQRKAKQIDETRELDKQLQYQSVLMTPAIRKKRLLLPTSETLNGSAKQMRCTETLNDSLAIHGGSGGSSDDKKTALIGIVDTLSSKFHAADVAKEVLTKPKLVNAIKRVLLVED